MKKMIIAANWKMNKVPVESAGFLTELKSVWKPQDGRELWIFPSFLNLALFKKDANGLPLKYGAQNCYFEASGAFTGEISPAMIKSVGGTHCLVGHSERRHIFKETDQDIAKKVRALIDTEIMPVLCIGETDNERSQGETLKRVEAQLEQGLAHYKKDAPITIAYEPVWSIGTGRVPTTNDIREVHAHVRKVFAKITGGQAPILYGGSVNAQNCRDIEAIEDVGGFLIGGASLKVPSLMDIYNGGGQ